ncbi:MAG: FHA domain-containing protein [Pseudomonadota bacterium]
MAKLIVSCEDAIVGHYFLDKARFVIGRKHDNDIALEGASVSNIHAIILTIGNDHVLEDAESTNGVSVNGAKITRHILQNNDVIELSGYQVKYVNQRAMSDMDFDKTMIMKSVHLDPETEALPRKDAMSGKPQLATATLSARSVKTNFPLGGVKDMKTTQAGEEILISRPLKTFGQAGVQVIMVSRRPQGYYVTHVEGKRHPRVNGKSIGSQPFLLRENDLIEAEDVKLKFFIKQSD